MFNIFKRILKALIASVIILTIGGVLSILSTLLFEMFPILAIVITVILLICAGFVFTSN